MDKPWKVRFLAWKVRFLAWKVRLKAWTTAHNACLIGSDAPKPLSLQRDATIHLDSRGMGGLGAVICSWEDEAA